MMGIAKGITGIGSRKRTKVRQQPEHGCRPDSPQLPAERSTDACRRIDGQALAGTHQSNAVATGSLIHIRSGNHNRNALPLQAVQHIPELHPGNRARQSVSLPIMEKTTGANIRERLPGYPINRSSLPKESRQRTNGPIWSMPSRLLLRTTVISRLDSMGKRCFSN